jgi:hypothetical protein
MISLENITSVKEFLTLQFSKKVQQSLSASLEQIYTNGRINIHDGSDKDVPLLFQFNNQQVSNDWLDLMKEFACDIFTITINKEVKAVSFSVLDTYTYLPLTIGYDTSIKELQTLLLISQLQRAIENQRSVFDPERIAKEWQTVFPTSKSKNNILAPAFQYQMN